MSVAKHNEPSKSVSQVHKQTSQHPTSSITTSLRTLRTLRALRALRTPRSHTPHTPHPHLPQPPHLSTHPGRPSP